MFTPPRAKWFTSGPNHLWQAENQITGLELLTPPESAGGSHISVMDVLAGWLYGKFRWQKQRINTIWGGWSSSLHEFTTFPPKKTFAKLSQQPSNNHPKIGPQRQLAWLRPHSPNFAWCPAKRQRRRSPQVIIEPGMRWNGNKETTGTTIATKDCKYIGIRKLLGSILCSGSKAIINHPCFLWFIPSIYGFSLGMVCYTIPCPLGSSTSRF